MLHQIINGQLIQASAEYGQSYFNQPGYNDYTNVAPYGFAKEEYVNLATATEYGVPAYIGIKRAGGRSSYSVTSSAGESHLNFDVSHCPLLDHMRGRLRVWSGKQPG